MSNPAGWECVSAGGDEGQNVTCILLLFYTFPFFQRPADREQKGEVRCVSEREKEGGFSGGDKKKRVRFMRGMSCLYMNISGGHQRRHTARRQMREG